MCFGESASIASGVTSPRNTVPPVLSTTSTVSLMRHRTVSAILIFRRQQRFGLARCDACLAYLEAVDQIHLLFAVRVSEIVTIAIGVSYAVSPTIALVFSWIRYISIHYAVSIPISLVDR